jgi:hypothetical protein
MTEMILLIATGNFYEPKKFSETYFQFGQLEACQDLMITVAFFFFAWYSRSKQTNPSAMSKFLTGVVGKNR